MHYAQELENVIAFFRAATNDYDFSYGFVGDREKEIQDLEHELELAAKDAKARSRVGRELQRVLIARRQHKNIVECTEPIAAYIKEHPKLLSELGTVLGKIRKAENYHATRQYVPRIRADLTISARLKDKKQL